MSQCVKHACPMWSSEAFARCGGFWPVQWFGLPRIDWGPGILCTHDAVWSASSSPVLRLWVHLQFRYFPLMSTFIWHFRNIQMHFLGPTTFVFEHVFSDSHRYAGTCIFKRLECNGDYDCENGEDEDCEPVRKPCGTKILDNSEQGRTAGYGYDCADLQDNSFTIISMKCFRLIRSNEKNVKWYISVSYWYEQ